ncbi:MAG TPA: hypothetical protein GXX35_00035 [Thermoanaerobacterales bacterium]|nr:hypothetical protein [Thermoanaerobacterales bacterium]
MSGVDGYYPSPRDSFSIRIGTSKLIVVFLIVILFLYLFYTYPQRCVVRMEGIGFRSGDVSFEEKVSVKIDGWYSKKLRGNEFEGSMFINDNELHEVNFKFDKYGNSSIFSYREDKGEYDFFGELFVDGRFEKLAICVFEKDIKNPGASHWSSKDGFVIAAPAASRDEALKIATELIGKKLKINLK